MRTQREVFERILSTVNGEPVSFMKLCRQCGFNYRTMKRSLELMEFLQKEQNKLEIMRDGFRVMIKRPDPSSNPDPVPSA